MVGPSGGEPVKAERLQKLIAAAGICSRRHAEALLREGRVSVNDRIAQLGDRADPRLDRITIDGTPLPANDPPRLLLLNKPRGVISSCQDPQGRPIVLDLVPKQLRRGLHPVGRLDAESRGALLLTNQGELTLQLTHPRYSHAKPTGSGSEDVHPMGPSNTGAAACVWINGSPNPRRFARYVRQA